MERRSPDTGGGRRSIYPNSRFAPRKFPRFRRLRKLADEELCGRHKSQMLPTFDNMHIPSFTVTQVKAGSACFRQALGSTRWGEGTGCHCWLGTKYTEPSQA